MSATPTPSRPTRRRSRREVEHRLVTDLSMEECRRRLSELRRRPRFLEPPRVQTGDPGVFGELQGERFRLYAVRVLFRNSFRRLFYGRLEADAGRTLIVGQFRVHPFVRAFIAVWLAVVGFFALVSTCAAIQPGGPDVGFGVAIAWGMLALGAAISFVGPRLSRPEEEAVLSYLEERLEASLPAA